MRIATVAATSLFALSLVACGENPGKQAVSAEDVREELASTEPLTAGQYASEFEVVRLNIPGLPPIAIEQFKGQMEELMQVKASYCITEGQARGGAEEMFRQLSSNRGQCNFSSFEVKNGDAEGELRCSAPGGASSTTQMTGSLENNQSTMTMVTDFVDRNLPQGRGQVEMRVTSRRTGDCTAASRAEAEATARQVEAAAKNRAAAE